MADAYRCDGCREYHDGAPWFVIEPTHQTLDMPPRWEACSAGCLVVTAEHVAERSRRRLAEEPT